MRDIIGRLRRRKMGAARRGAAPGMETIPGNATENVGNGTGEPAPGEPDEKQAKRMHEILWEIGYVE